MIFGSHFIYRGEDSRDYGFVMCSFDGVGLDNAVGTYMTSQYSDIPQMHFKPVYAVNFDGVLEFNVQIGKCSGEPYTRLEIEEILKWLSKRKYDWISFYDDDIVEVAYYAYPSKVDKKKMGSDVYGFEITFTTNSALAWSPVYQDELSVTTANQQLLIGVDTDEDDYTYPYIEITKRGNGDISIENLSDKDLINKLDTYTTTISNCADGEKIIMDCQAKVIHSSDQINHKFFRDDFNFKYVRLVPGVNKLVINGNCDIAYKYRTKKKVGEY